MLCFCHVWNILVKSLKYGGCFCGLIFSIVFLIHSREVFSLVLVQINEIARIYIIIIKNCLIHKGSLHPKNWLLNSGKPGFYLQDLNSYNYSEFLFQLLFCTYSTHWHISHYFQPFLSISSLKIISTSVVISLPFHY